MPVSPEHISSLDPPREPQTRVLSRLRTSLLRCLRHLLPSLSTPAPGIAPNLLLPHFYPLGNHRPSCTGFGVFLDSCFKSPPHSVCQHILQHVPGIDARANHCSQPPLSPPWTRPPPSCAWSISAAS